MNVPRRHAGIRHRLRNALRRAEVEDAPVTPLDPAEAARLTAAAHNYDHVGYTRADPPADYGHFSRSRVLRGVDFETAAEDLMCWRIQQRAGFDVIASSPRVAEGVVVVMRLGFSHVALRAPCRVVYVIDEPDGRAFAYGTLPGHPESGEERFELRRHSDGRVELTVSAFSRPASTLARLGGPLTRRAQTVMTSRYLRALDG